ncbi:MAG: putative bifunctional diguanylate cyclase/phosphodiesterase [Propylenella sp.]
MTASPILARPESLGVGRAARLAGPALGAAVVLVGFAAYALAAERSSLAAFAAIAGLVFGGGVCVMMGQLANRLEGAELDLATAMEALRDAETASEIKIARLLVAVNNMAQGLCMFGPDRRLIFSNTQYADLYGLPHQRVQPGMTVPEIVKYRIAAGNVPVMGEENYAAMMAGVAERGEPAEIMIEQTDGRVFLLGYVPLKGGGWVATHQDITDRRRAEAKIAHMARHDTLTDLPNRTSFRAALEDSLRRAGEGEGVAVLCLDLDRFKTVNDTLGHHIGDLLLLDVAGRLKRCLRAGDTVARLSGDEFAVVQVCAQPSIDATALARRIVAEIEKPYELDGHQVVVGASIGIAVAPGDGSDADRLMKSADMALYRAKADGRGTFRFFEPAMDAHIQARRRLESDLRRALADGEFELHYQPIVNAVTGGITTCEALIRWNSPKRGVVSPAEFVPLAEEIGLIVPIGEWVFRRACADAVSWPSDVKLAVNLSPVQLRSANVVPAIKAALAESGLPAKRLEIEITETVLMTDSEATLAKLHQLRDLGAEISMDDFGTGYSSLSYLRKFPFDRIKIDRSFIHDMTRHDDSFAIVRAVSALGRSLGMATTAEGVETAEQLDRVRLEGCTEAQGYLFSAPKPAIEIADLLRSRASRIRAVA